ncbi:MAG: Ig-like domain-containing protein, partial [Verrucomicrobiota bacterium]
MNSYPQKTVVARPKSLCPSGRSSPRLLGVLLALLVTVVLSATAKAANWVVVSRSIVSESCPNGAIDPGETNRVSFVIKNDTDTVYEEVQVRLRPNSGNVDFVLDGFTGKTTVDKRANLTVEFSFRAKGACGETLTATLDVKAKTSDGNGTVVFGGDKTFQLGRTTDTTYPFSGGAITINDRAQPDNDAHGKASPYPSTLTVANVPNQTGLTGERVSKVTVTLRNLTHGFSPDISAVLVSPWGQKVLLMRNAGNGAVGGIDVTLDSGASSSLPLNGPLFTGSFKPTDNEPGDANLPDVAGPYSTDLGSFNINAAQADQNGGQFRNPNGDWKLYVQDTQNGSSGTIGGWDLRITTSKIVCCGAGETFPTITTVIDGNPEPRIDEVVENEDALYVDNDPPPSQSPVDLRSPIKAFQVNDLETAAGSLTVTATSGNQNIIKDSNLRIKGSGVDRTIEFKPEANANGNVGITVRVTDGTSRSSTATFNLKVNSINDTPAVSEIRGVKVPRGTATAPISFTVGDVETQSDFLVPTVQSVSDTSVLGPGNVFFGGSGPNRTVQVFPANPGASGTQGAADITVRVSDLDGGFTDRSFRVDFSLAPGQPTITPLAASSTDEDTPKDIGFTVTSTVGTSAGSLQVTRTSSNQNLVPVGNITINGSGSDRTIHIVPAADRNSGLQRQPPGAGTTDITITVTDPGNGASSSTTFTFTVNPKNDAPTISVVADQTISEDSNTGELAFTVGDQETPASSLTVSADSSNTALVDAGGISLSGSGANRSIKVTPIANAFGRTTITVRVSDDGDNGDAPKSTTRNFVVTVNGVNDAPVITQAQQPGQTVVNLAGNDTDSPVVVTINEDLVDGGHPDGQFVDGDASKGVIEQTVSLLGITAGAGDEREQTVSLAASVDRSDIISSVRFDTSNGKTDDKVKSPNTGTTLIYRPARNASGTAIVTLVLTDNGVGGNGVNVLSTVRKFKIVVKAINDAPSFADVTKKTIPRRNPTAIPIDISDVETPKAFLKVTATSSDNSLIKDANIVVDPNRNFITVTPEDVVIGTPPPTTTITVRVEDLGATNSEDGNSDPAAQPKAISRSFVVEVANVLPPTVTLARDSDTINEDDLTGNTLIVGDNNPISDANMTVSVSSDNLVLVPATSIALGPFAVGTPPAGQANGATKQIIIDPADNQSGTANISIRVTDSEGLSVIRTYRLTVLPVEDAPSISVRTSTASDTKWTFPSGQPPVFNTKEDANPVRDEKTDSKLIEISVSDPETPNNITLSASSKVPTTTTDSPVIPPGNITIGGTGGTRTLTIVPAPNKNGTARITVTATDGAGLNSSAIFDVNVAAINDPPTMDAVSNITVDEDSGEFVVALKNIGPGPEEGGIQQVVDILVTEKNKGSDPATHTVIDLVNNGSDYADGSTTYNLRIRPKANASGTAEVSVKLTDNGANGGDDVNNRTFTFDFVVGDFNDAPTISFSPNSQLNNAEVTTAQGVPSQVVPFYINDAETSSTALQVSAVSSNPNLVPNTAANLQVGGSAANRGIIVVPA